MDLQSLSLVRLLLRAGADPNHLSYGGFSPFHLTYGRHDDDIRNALFPLTEPSLRELPDSEPEDSEDEGEKDEEDGQTDEEVCGVEDRKTITAAGGNLSAPRLNILKNENVKKADTSNG